MALLRVICDMLTHLHWPISVFQEGRNKAKKWFRRISRKEARNSEGAQRHIAPLIGEP